ncbi:MAG: DUF2066 domain-containing protein [Proteobacteria bacterium]|nr:DUF2066 domain-containing protein [Pseudomonadota bacterium]
MKIAVMLRRFVLLLPLLAVAHFAPAQSLYTGKVPVNSQSDTERSEALKSALAQVVVKLAGGDNAVLARPGVAQAVAQAGNYVQQYQYTQDVTTGADGKPQARLSLVAQFDRTAVDKLVAGLGLGAASAPGDAQTAQAASDTQAQNYRVWIGGLHSAVDYARAIGALSRNELVRSVQAEQARGDGVELRLSITGPLPRLLDSLATSPLQVDNAKPPVDGVDALLSLRAQ